MTEETTTHSTEESTTTDESADAPHIFMLRRDETTPIPTRAYHTNAPNFGYKGDDEAYHLVEDDEVASYLRQRTKDGTPFFRWVTPERLEAILDSADDAIDAIEDGEHDDVLDLLLFAERKEFGNRVTVIDAIAARRREVEEARQAQSGDAEDALSPEDVAPARGE